MSYSIIFVLIFAMIAIDGAQSECTSTFCTNVCKNKGFVDGQCNEEICKCELVKKSSLIGTPSTIGIKFCPLSECVEPCSIDPSGVRCRTIGGFVSPVVCWMNGYKKGCLCRCTMPRTKDQMTSDEDSSSSEIFRYDVNSQ